MLAHIYMVGDIRDDKGYAMGRVSWDGRGFMEYEGFPGMGRVLWDR